MNAGLLRGVGGFSLWDRVGWVGGALFTLHYLVLAYSVAFLYRKFLNPAYPYLLVLWFLYLIGQRKGPFMICPLPQKAFFLSGGGAILVHHLLKAGIKLKHWSWEELWQMHSSTVSALSYPVLHIYCPAASSRLCFPFILDVSHRILLLKSGTQLIP